MEGSVSKPPTETILIPVDELPEMKYRFSSDTFLTTASIQQLPPGTIAIGDDGNIRDPAMKMFLAIKIWDPQLTPSNHLRFDPRLPDMALIGSNRLCAITPLLEHPYRLRNAQKSPTKARNPRSLAIKATGMKEWLWGKIKAVLRCGKNGVRAGCKGFTGRIGEKGTEKSVAIGNQKVSMLVKYSSKKSKLTFQQMNSLYGLPEDR
jgi:hypothetical protein